MKKEHVLALFQMAGFETKSIHELPNGYWPQHPDYDSVRTPWWLVHTQYGLIKIGWRKRVISIDWETTDFRDEERLVAEGDDTTSLDDLVHAWTYTNALKYLTTLQQLMKKKSLSAATVEV
jgi:hypothetical protein